MLSGSEALVLLGGVHVEQCVLLRYKTTVVHALTVSFALGAVLFGLLFLA